MASDKQQKKQQNHENKTESSLTRLSKIPAVGFSIYLSLSLYNKVKSSNELFTNVLNKAERIVFTTFDSLKPLTTRFESQINYVDSLGNSALDKLEATVPAVNTFEPRNVYANAVNRVLSWRRYASDKLNLVRNLELNKTVSGGLQTVDNLVDEYLPGDGTENETNENRVNSEDGVVPQLFGIFGKLRKRTFNRVQNIQRLVF